MSKQVTKWDTSNLAFAHPKDKKVRLKNRRISLTRLFGSCLTGILTLFILITGMAYLRLVDFSHLIADVSADSVPSITSSAEIYTEINHLPFLSANLANASSDAARRIAQQKISERFQSLRTQIRLHVETPYLAKQLDTMESELAELDTLVSQRLAIAEDLRQKHTRVHEWYEQLLVHTLEHSDHDPVLTDNAWSLLIVNIVILSSEAAHTDRLHLVRKLSDDISAKFGELAVMQADMTAQERGKTLPIIQNMRALLIGENGLITEKVKQLQLNGRVRGRGNFVANLIQDYARLAEFKSYQINQRVLEDSRKAAEKVNQQIRIFAIALFAALILLLTIGYFLHVHVVGRLINLNKRVKKRSSGPDNSIVIGGNDEITDIATTFEEFALTIEKQKHILHDMSMSDGLTGIANRRAFDERLLKEFALARRQNWSLSVLLLDVDFFKAFNDKYGHARGDECLTQLAQVFSGVMQRDNDFVARYGGEEFVVILPDTDALGAKQVAEKLLENTVTENIPHCASGVAKHITISIGVACAKPCKHLSVSPAKLLQRADKALYAAKSAGRNCYRTHATGTESSLDSCAL